MKPSRVEEFSHPLWNRAGPERSRLLLRVILDEVEHIASTLSSVFHSATAAQRGDDDPAAVSVCVCVCVCLCVCVMANGHTTNSLSRHSANRKHAHSAATRSTCRSRALQRSCTLSCTAATPTFSHPPDSSLARLLADLYALLAMTKYIY